MPVLLGTTAVLMEAHRITHMAGATPFLRGLLDAAKAVDTRLPHLKLFICGGASVPPALNRTGDLGAWIDGCLTVTGRIKDLIIRNGENIAPKEIEDLLVSHPRIAEVAIVVLPDPRPGERAVAVIVPRGGDAPGVAELGALLAKLCVARFKVPEAVASWPALSKNDPGKVLKQAVRERLFAGEAQ